MMPVPMFKQSHYLIATIRQAITDADLKTFAAALVCRVCMYDSRAVILDVTELDVLDSFFSRMLRDIAHMVGLRGVETIIAGIQPEVAFAMARLGINLENVSTVHDLEEGLEYLERK